MTTQVFKTRSKIVKAVAAAVLLAAGTTTFAETNDYFKHENTTTIASAQLTLMASLNTAISLSTGIDNVPAYLDFTKQYGKQITEQGETAVQELKAGFIAVNPAQLFDQLTAALPASVASEDVVVLAESNDYISILPSIASIGAEYEANMQRALHTVALQTIDYAMSVSFADTAEHLE